MPSPSASRRSTSPSGRRPIRPRRLPRAFFARPTLTVARDLLGKILIRQVGHRMIVGRITEVEAYRGEDDLACHASRGRTRRTETMYGTPGTAYVYQIYGMYHCLNLVTERRDFPAAVLVRSCRPLRGAGIEPVPDADDAHLLTFPVGPGRLCRYFQVTRALNGEDLVRSKNLWLADDSTRVAPTEILRASRIGVEYAGPAAAWPWRFIDGTSPFVSVKPRM